MEADALATQVARASAAMVLIYFSWNILRSVCHPFCLYLRESLAQFTQPWYWKDFKRHNSLNFIAQKVSTPAPKGLSDIRCNIEPSDLVII